MNFSFKRMLSFFVCSTLLLACGCSSKRGTAEKETASKEDDGIINIACVGDSLTQGIGASGWQDGDYSNAYPQQLNEILGSKYKVGNFGKGGSYVYYEDGRTESLWYPNTVQYSLSNQFEADVVILMLGTNDARVMASKADSAEFKQQFIELLEHYLDLPTKPTVYIASGLPMKKYDSRKKSTESDWLERDPLYREYILPIQREVAEEYNCKFLDLYHDLYTEFTEQDTFASDDLHPNDKGYRIIAEYISQNLDL